MTSASPRNTSPRGHHRRWLRPLLALLVLAVIGIAAFLLTTSLRDDDEEPLVLPEPQFDDPEQELVHRFAPIYQLRAQEHACDHHGESFEPTLVDILLQGNEGFRLHMDGAPAISGPSASDIVAADGTAYLDYPGDPRSPGCRYERDFRQFAAGTNPSVYARIAREPEQDGLALQYWAYYYFNDWNNKHEGDWEMVQLVFDVETVEEALETVPEYTVYAQHGGGERRDWDDVQTDGIHPLVYVSAGSHASYYESKTYLGLGEPGTGFGCDIALEPHRTITPDIVLQPDQPPAGEAPAAWSSFQGRWGQRLASEFNGPTGPQTKGSYREPLTWAEGARTGSVTMPGGDLIGVNAVHSFCGAVSAGSDVLRAFLQYPFFVGGAFIILLGSLAVSGLVVARDFTRSPLVGRDTRDFLHHRRSTGQMIRAAIIVYSRHPRLFLGISLGFIPLNIVLSLVQDWLLQLPPFAWLGWMLDGNAFSQLVTGLLVGGITSMAVYLLVMPGAIAAAVELDEGRPTGVREAYRDALEHAVSLLLARGRALAIIALFGVSILGLPVAIWLAVRWYFTEQAVLIDRHGSWPAPAASSRAVEGQWWRSLRLVLCFGIFGAAAGPLLAFAFLLGTGLDPAFVNLIAGLFHTAVLPFTALGLSMAYCDLQTRNVTRHRPTSPPPREPNSRLERARIAAMRALHRYEGR